MTKHTTPSESVLPEKGHPFSSKVTPFRHPTPNVPSARELVQREFKQPSDGEDVFEEVFRNMDDETFWQLIECIGEAGYSIQFADTDIAEAHQKFENTRSAPGET